MFVHLFTKKIKNKLIGKLRHLTDRDTPRQQETIAVYLTWRALPDKYNVEKIVILRSMEKQSLIKFGRTLQKSSTSLIHRKHVHERFKSDFFFFFFKLDFSFMQLARLIRLVFVDFQTGLRLHLVLN